MAMILLSTWSAKWNAWWKKLIFRGSDNAASQTSMKRTWSQVLQVLNDRFWLKDMFMFCILITFAFVGACLFSMVECPTQNRRTSLEKEKRERHRADMVQKVLNLLSECSLNNTEDHRKLLVEAVKKYEDDIGARKEFNESCSFISSLFYAMTIFTTIGYGQGTCVTNWGRAMTIIYGMIGIPLMFALVNGLGKRIFVHARRKWNQFRRFTLRMHSRYLYKQDPNAQWPPKCHTGSICSVASGTMAVEEVVDENFPLNLSLGLVISYMFMCSAIFMIWEHSWDYFTAFYFFFISLSTIGFGDVVPESLASTLLGFPFYVIGLALVTFCINVIQAKVERSCDITVEQMYKGLESMLTRMGNEVTISSSLGVAPLERTLSVVMERPMAEEKEDLTKPGITDGQDTQRHDGEPPVDIIEIYKSPRERKITLRKYSCRETHGNVRGLNLTRRQQSSASLATEFAAHRIYSPSVSELSINELSGSPQIMNRRLHPISRMRTQEDGVDPRNVCMFLKFYYFVVKIREPKNHCTFRNS